MLYLSWDNRQKNTSMKLYCLKQKELKHLSFFIHRRKLNKTLCTLIPLLIPTLDTDTLKKKTVPGRVHNVSGTLIYFA